MKIAALCVLLAFYASYFIKMILLRRRNIQVDILGKGKKPKGQARLEIVLKTVTFLGATVQFISVLWDKAIWALPTFSITRAGGLFLMLCALTLFILAMIAMRDNWRAGYNEEQNTNLVTTGIYQYSRNPAFLGFGFLYIGCALLFPNWLNLTLTIIALLLFHLEILSEEKFCTSAFGQKYSDYSAITRRYLGRKKH